MFGINGGEFLILLLVAVIVIGPERLPKYAEQLGSVVRQARKFVKDAKSKVDEELGDEFRDVDWAKLDPRQYDPRRIVREALLDDPPAGKRAPGTGPASAARPAAAPTAATPAPATAAAPVDLAKAAPPPAPAPFDDEAT